MHGPEKTIQATYDLLGTPPPDEPAEPQHTSNPNCGCPRLLDFVRASRVPAARVMGARDRSKAQLQAELEIARAGSAPRFSEFRAIQTIIAAGTAVRA